MNDVMFPIKKMLSRRVKMRVIPLGMTQVIRVTRISSGDWLDLHGIFEAWDDLNKS